MRTSHNQPWFSSPGGETRVTESAAGHPIFLSRHAEYELQRRNATQIEYRVGSQNCLGNGISRCDRQSVAGRIMPRVKVVRSARLSLRYNDSSITRKQKTATLTDDVTPNGYRYVLWGWLQHEIDRKSTRLNSSHLGIS